MLTALVMSEDISDARTPMPMTWKIWGANCTQQTKHSFRRPFLRPSLPISSSSSSSSDEG